MIHFVLKLIYKFDRKFFKSYGYYIYDRILSLFHRENVDFDARCNAYAAVRNLTKNSIVIDGGANVGDETAVFAKRAGTVYAFEPSPACYKELCKRFQATSNVHLYPCALSDRDTEATYYFNHRFTRWNPTLYSKTGGLYDIINVKDLSSRVKCIDLCAFIESLNAQVDLVKLDIEGMEYAVLNKLIETGIYKKCNTILVETHSKMLPQFTEADSALRALIKERSITNIDLTWD